MLSSTKKKITISPKVVVIGLGYIGFPTYLLLSRKLNSVYGFDTDQNKIEKIKRGNFQFNETDLNKIYKRLILKKKINVSRKLIQADVYLITVQTPIKISNQPDLKYLIKAIKNICKVLNKDNLIIIESTSPVGTIDKIIKIIKSIRNDLFIDNVAQFNISYCPERLLPGNTIRELKNNTRIIGGLTKLCSKKSANIYKIFSSSKFYYTDSKTAELCKIAENTYRDINIAFANYLKIYSNHENINASELINLANLHPRVNIHQSGIGVGGHCIPVDPLFLLKLNKRNLNDKLITSSRLINDSMPNYTYENIIKKIGKDNIKKIRITILGISYKANTDDIRNSPAIKILKKLNNYKFKKINYCDPNIKTNILKKYKINKINLKELYKSSDVLVKLVDHREFNKIDKTVDKKILLIDYTF